MAGNSTSRAARARPNSRSKICFNMTGFDVVAEVVLIDVRLYVVYAATSGTLTLGLDM